MRLFVDKRLQEPISDGNVRFLNDEDDLSSLDKSRIVGKGTTGIVYQVSFQKRRFTKELGTLDNYVAKLFLDDQRGSEGVYGSGYNRMMQELGAAGKLDHAGLIRPVACYSDKKKPILVFPFWNGGTLEEMFRIWKRIDDPPVDRIKIPFSDKIKARLQIFKERRMELGQALLEIVSHMHKRKMLHCDLHGKNILLHFPEWRWTMEHGGGVVSVADNDPKEIFIGIADTALCQSFTEANHYTSHRWPRYQQFARCLPPPHIAPELSKLGGNLYNIDSDQPYTTDTDVFALGSTLRRLCADFYRDGDNTKDFAVRRIIAKMTLSDPTQKGRIRGSAYEHLLAWRRYFRLENQERVYRPRQAYIVDNQPL